MKSLYTKKKKGYRGLKATEWTPHKDHHKWNSYCVDNNIRLALAPTSQGMYPEEWRIVISLGPYKRGEKPYLSPNVYTIDNVYEELERMKKYYYDKRKVND